MPNDKSLQNTVALTALVVIIILGAILLAVYLFSGEGLPWNFTSESIVSNFTRNPAISIVAAMLFTVGAMMCIHVHNPFLVIFLLPLTLVAILPLLDNEDYMPANTVAAFNLEDCPNGWIEFSELAGRVIVGTGGAGNTDKNGKPLTLRTWKDAGGEEMHLLTEPEMPLHFHKMKNFDELGYDNQDEKTGASKYRVTWDNNKPWEGNTKSFETKNAGESKPHNNMQPYYVLTYCRKMLKTERIKKSK